MLEAVDVRIRGAVAWTNFVANLDYNAKGQREKIVYGNGTFTEYTYELLTFRLAELKTTRTSSAALLQDLTYTYDPPSSSIPCLTSFGVDPDDVDPDDKEIHMNVIAYGSPEELDLAEALRAFEEGRLHEAQTKLRELVNRFSDDDRVVGKLGYIEFELGNHDEARRLLLRATELDPKRELWSVGLFHALWELRRTHEAFGEARRYLTIHPSAAEYNRLLAELKDELDEAKAKP